MSGLGMDAWLAEQDAKPVFLPPLPDPSGYDGGGETLAEMATYSADRVREYAYAAVLAERKRCATITQNMGAPRSEDFGDWANPFEAIENGLNP